MCTNSKRHNILGPRTCQEVHATIHLQLPPEPQASAASGRDGSLVWKLWKPLTEGLQQRKIADNDARSFAHSRKHDVLFDYYAPGLPCPQIGTTAVSMGYDGSRHGLRGSYTVRPSTYAMQYTVESCRIQ